MKRFRADLHIHTGLSPCSTVEMTPPAIVEAALGRGLGLIAISDHNATGNVGATQEAAGGRIAVIPGMEITTVEDVHVLGLFPDLESACRASERVQATLPNAAKAQRKLGDQFLMNAQGDVIGEEPKMLWASSGLDLTEAVRVIREQGGLAIAAHVDRPSFSVMSQLGMFPTDVSFDAIEISAVGVRGGKMEDFRSLGLPMVCSSDSHFVADVGACSTVLEMREATFVELGLALRRVEGRSCGDA